jgi:hypothetical protein
MLPKTIQNKIIEIDSIFFLELIQRMARHNTLLFLAAAAAALLCTAAPAAADCSLPCSCAFGVEFGEDLSGYANTTWDVSEFRVRCHCICIVGGWVLAWPALLCCRSAAAVLGYGWACVQRARAPDTHTRPLHFPSPAQREGG